MKRTIKLTIEIEADEQVLNDMPDGKGLAEQIKQDFIDALNHDVKITVTNEYDE